MEMTMNEIETETENENEKEKIHSDISVLKVLNEQCGCYF